MKNYQYAIVYMVLFVITSLLVRFVNNHTWDVIIVCIALFTGWVIWEIDHAPLMPDDYDER